jgi:archaeal cell division control protein 6
MARLNHHGPSIPTRRDGGTFRERELNRDIVTAVDALQTTISEFGAHRSTIEYLPDSDEEFTMT